MTIQLKFQVDVSMLTFRFAPMLALTLLVVTACSILPDPRDTSQRSLPTPSQASVESFIGAALPESASNIYSAEDGFQDTIMWVRFDVLPSDLPAFLESLGVEGSLDPEASAPTPHDATWWEPDTATIRAGVIYRTGINTSCSLLVDQSRSEQWRLYIACFNT
jgi:hypothetical protein